MLFLAVLFLFIVKVPASAEPLFNPNDLTAPCGLSVEELSPVLKGLSDYAEEFLAAEEKYGVNAVFLASLAAFESGWGKHCFRQNNLFGWGKKEFCSKEECIDFVARRIPKPSHEFDFVFRFQDRPHQNVKIRLVRSAGEGDQVLVIVTRTGDV